MAAVDLTEQPYGHQRELDTSDAVPIGANRFALVCSAIVVAAMTLGSLLGLFVRGLYQEQPWAVAALRGNDLITLVVVAPAVGLALINHRRSPRWTIVWLGGLLYGVYNFAYYAFGTSFNDVFLLHVAAMALSLAALVALATGLDVDAIAACLPARPVDRVIAAYMTLVGAALISAWGGLSLRFAISGELPHSVMPPSAVHLVYALDMSLLAPAFLTGGLLLWRRRPWGYALGIAVNFFGAVYLLVLEFVGGFEANAGIKGTTWNSPPAIGGTLLCAVAVIALLRRCPRKWPTDDRIMSARRRGSAGIAS